MVFKNDVGTKIVLNVGQNISASTVRQIRYKKTNGAVGLWLAALEGTTKISYITGTGELDVVGTWELQAYVEMTGTKNFGKKVFLVVSDTI